MSKQDYNGLHLHIYKVHSGDMEMNQSYFVNKGEFNIKQDGFLAPKKRSCRSALNSNPACMTRSG